MLTALSLRNDERGKGTYVRMVSEHGDQKRMYP